jgi:hypothetical protein
VWAFSPNGARLFPRVEETPNGRRGVARSSIRGMRLPRHDPGEPQIAPGVHAQHLDFRVEVHVSAHAADFRPQQPMLPAVRDQVGERPVDLAALLSMSPPPIRTAKAPALGRPVGGKMLWQPLSKLLPQARDDDTDRPAALDEA